MARSAEAPRPCRNHLFRRPAQGGNAGGEGQRASGRPQLAARRWGQARPQRGVAPTHRFFRRRNRVMSENNWKPGVTEHPDALDCILPERAVLLKPRTPDIYTE